MTDSRGRREVRISEVDGVLGALEDVPYGTGVRGPCGEVGRVRDHMAFGHKIALEDTAEGACMIKYGAQVGGSLNRLPPASTSTFTMAETKVEAMSAIGVQSYLKDYYTELAGRRGNHARRISGNQSIRYAEALQRMLPRVVEEL